MPSPLKPVMEINTKNAQDAVKEAYDKLSKAWHEYDFRDRWDYMFSKLTTDHRLLSMINLKGKIVLNVGCSEPIDEIFYARKVRAWVAIDFHEPSIKKARQMVVGEISTRLQQNIAWVTADAKNLPFRDGVFDIVTSFSTIDHIPTQNGRQTAFCEISRVTKKAGYLAVTVPNKLNLAYYIWSNWHQKRGSAYYGYEYQFHPFELRKQLHKVGFRTIRFVSNFVLPLSIWLRVLEPVSKFLELFGFRMGFLAQKR